ncbi:flagellar motor protein MotD [Fulvimonas soli]|uniref:Chemotaxis protein MotB n=1 Tax=Fulvimonas soli TaxID=155197 RepID=A0A316HP96_9GAMM|nr:flagellar motor protein MotD [Fulvimonas soli]PWK83058.1 chemotaxis protein MotB [Fulvimonas soli]TNY25130.1 flagellar motor protein MotB [Fulvimonas soli]
MSRRKRREEHINHEAWAIPYADLMTLLLAFFVVMYAVSVVNEGKYRVMSESIIEAFNGSSHVIAPMPPKPTKPKNVDPALAAPQGQPGAAVTPVALPIPQRPAPSRQPDALRPAPVSAQQQNLARIQDQVQRAMQPLIDRNLIVVRRSQNWLEIEIRTDILFPSGVAQLSAQAGAVLDSLAGILAPFSNPLRVEGYTDDKPINTAVYPSNWELSAARAASVARLFAEHGVEPSRLGIIGWGEYRPAADNATAEGRNRNRRVLVVVLSDDKAPARFYSDPDKPTSPGEPAPPQVAQAGAAPAPASALPGATPPATNALPAAVAAAPGAAASHVVTPDAAGPADGGSAVSSALPSVPLIRRAAPAAETPAAAAPAVASPLGSATLVVTPDGAH